jgi:uncharacterized membrane protein YeiH
MSTSTLLLVLDLVGIAVFAASGALIVAVGDRLGAPNTVLAVVAIITTFAIRVVSCWRKWSAPVPAARDN